MQFDIYLFVWMLRLSVNICTIPGSDSSCVRPFCQHSQRQKVEFLPDKEAFFNTFQWIDYRLLMWACSGGRLLLSMMMLERKWNKPWVMSFFSPWAKNVSRFWKAKRRWTVRVWWFLYWWTYTVKHWAASFIDSLKSDNQCLWMTRFNVAWF